MSAEVITAIVACLLALAGLIGAVASWIKTKTETERIRNERLKTKGDRDKDSLAIHDMLLKHEFAITSLKDSQTLNATVVDDLKDQVNLLNTNVVKLTVVVEQLGETMRELKDKK